MMEDKEVRESNEEEVAKAKLQLFVSSDLEHFAIRYMNEGEYQSWMENGLREGAETRLMNQEIFGKERLLSGTRTGRWIARSAQDTNWGGILDGDLRIADRLTYEFGEARRHAKNKAGNIRQNTLSELARILQEKNFGMDLRQSGWDEFEAFINEPLQYDSLKLRNLLNVLSRNVANEKDELNAPYHIMVVLSPDALDMRRKSWGQNDWVEVKKDADPQNLIAAFAMLPQKDLVRDMITISARASELAHPVFDTHGIVRWPAT